MRVLVLGSVLLACATLHATERYTGSAQPEDKLPLVVVVHGFGATPEDILGLVTDLPVRARLFAPHGAIPVGPGWSWFSHTKGGSDELTPGMTIAAAQLEQAITDEVRTRPTCGRPIVVGFSQGGMLSWALAASAHPVVGLAVPVGGLLPRAMHPRTRSKDAPRVRAFHGEADPRVSLDADRGTQAAFSALGYDATLKTYPDVPHTITPAEANDVRAVITDAIRASGCSR